MAEIIRFPGKRVGDLTLQDEIHHATVGGIEVLVARIVTETGPPTWGVFLRGEGMPDALALTVEMEDPSTFGQFLGQMASAVEGTLTLARKYHEPLMREPEPLGVA